MTHAALFDWDGTLLDSRAALLGAWRAATEQVLGRRYPNSPAEEREVWTLPGRVLFQHVASSREQAEALAGAFRVAYERTGRDVRAYDGVAELIDDLRRAGVALAVVTSKARERFELDAERIGLAGRFDASVTSFDTAAHKPDPAPVLLALERLGVAADRAVMVGDTEVDVAAARGAGVTAIAVAWGPLGPDGLTGAGAAAVASDPADLARIVMHDPERIAL